MAAKKTTKKKAKKVNPDVNNDGKVDEKDVKIVKEAAKKSTAKKSKPKGWSKAQKEQVSKFAYGAMRTKTHLTQKASEVLGEFQVEQFNLKQIAFKDEKSGDRLPEKGYFSTI